jgi:hypothetical protein
MILEVSSIQKHPILDDFCCIFIKRQEPEINNNQVYIQKVLGSKKSVKWFRQNIVKQMANQKQK